MEVEYGIWESQAESYLKIYKVGVCIRNKIKEGGFQEVEVGKP